ncbi:MAG TPA: glycosyltransferase [Candidatus Methylomirabilis sp.]|nr:glycosyltransferase [Candidatus Methylomirabilis sp.]
MPYIEGDVINQKLEKPLVSVIVPCLNSENIIKSCLESIKYQTYSNIEIIVVDAQSTDLTQEIAQDYGEVFTFKLEPYMVWGTPYQQNFGAAKAKGKYVYFVDTDMVLQSEAIDNYARKMESENADSMIIPEISYGEGFWAKCKILERSCYLLGDNTIEAPRFHKKIVWDEMGGLDPRLGGHYDWDMHNRLRQKGYKIIRNDIPVYHNEGKLSLKKLVKKKYIYGKSTEAYINKYKNDKNLYRSQFNLIRPIYFKNWRALIRDPIHLIGFSMMKTVEASALFMGFIVNRISRE